MGPNISCGFLLYHTLHLYKVSWKSEGVTSQVWLISYGMTQLLFVQTWVNKVRTHYAAKGEILDVAKLFINQCQQSVIGYECSRFCRDRYKYICKYKRVATV